MTSSAYVNVCVCVYMCACTDELLMLLSSEILVGTETEGGALLGHALNASQQVSSDHHDNNEVKQKTARPVRQVAPEDCG